MKLRQPIITIMGHIDSGKTTFLDKVKGTNIVLKEAGRITQHIGATEITLELIKKLCENISQKYKFDLKIPGLLFIDTPGHNAFDNLRERGGSLADLVVLVVDINKGFQAQDLQTIEILKMYKTPFIIAANKIDLISGFYKIENDNTTGFKKSILETIEMQSKKTQEILDELIYRIVGQLYNLGFPSERFDRITDFTKNIAIIPTSAEYSLGISECLLFLAGLSQKYLDKKLIIEDGELAQGTVLESSEIKGVGQTADIILYQGNLKVKDSICFMTRNGICETKIKSLLKLDVMSGVVQKRNYTHVEFVYSACGIKIVAQNLNECIPGSVIVLSHDKAAINDLKNKPLVCIRGESGSEQGAFVKADTLGSLEALLNLLAKNKICVARADIGEVTPKEFLELKILHSQNKNGGVLFLFNTNISKDLEKEAESLKIPIFKNNIIYKLIEDYLDWLKLENKKEQDVLKKGIIYPCSFKVLRNHIFRACKPAVFGVKIISGKLVTGGKVVNNGNNIGQIDGVQLDGKTLLEADTGCEVAISIKNASYLKDFQEEEILEIALAKTDLEKLEKFDYKFSSEELKLIEKYKKLTAN
ncbi:MAG: translation initiation factor IF-2 [archaeon]